jgi:hypothetical protein
MKLFKKKEIPIKFETAVYRENKWNNFGRHE